MGLHMNTNQVWYAVSPELATNAPFPGPAKVLFQHTGVQDQYIVSLGFVVDSSNRRLLGALYGAGSDPGLSENRIFGAWLQKRVLFINPTTVWGIGDGDRALGPDTVMVATNAQTLQGQFYVYDTDYVNADQRGTLLAVSEVVIVEQGDIWQYSP